MAMAGGGGGPSYPVGKVSAESRAQTTGLRYADIPEEEMQRTPAQERVRRAAERARLASRDVLQDPPPKRQVSPRANAPAGATAANIPVKASKTEPSQPSTEMVALEMQVKELKSLVERFQHMPQVPMS